MFCGWRGGLPFLAAALLLGGEARAQTCLQRPPGVVWGWDGDSRYGSLVRQVAPGELTGTVFGTLSVVNGLVGKAFSFDGATTRLDMSGLLLPDSTTRMSVEFWMQSTGPQPESKFTVMSKGHDVTGPNGWFVEGNTSTGRIGFGYGNGVNFTNFVQTTTNVIDGLWHHVAATFDTSLSSNQMKIYLDGVQQATRTTTDPIATNTNNFVVGRCNCSSGIRWYRGNLDEPMTYNRALSAAEIQAIFNAGGAGKCRFRLQQGQTQKLRATDHDPNTPTPNEFGNVVAADGDTIVVGDRSVTIPGFGTTGTASVYRRSGNTWVVEQRLLPEAPRNLLSLSIEGDRLVWGGLDHVLVFNRSGSTWTRETTIVVTPGSAHFGDDVDLSGDRFIAGMVGDTPPNASGSARVYVRAANGTWSLQATLRPSDLIDGNLFGGSVAIEGDLALASTQNDDQAGANAGAVYAFRWNGSSWSQIAKILPWVGGSNGFAGDRFGAAVALRGGMALIGAPGDDDGGSNAGAGYVMRWDGSAWQQEAKLVATDSKVADSMGGRELFDADPYRQHVALDATGTLAILGAEGVDHVTAGEAAKAGAAYVFVREIRGGQPYWRERDKLLSTDNIDEGIVGQSVAVLDDFAVAGCNGFSLHAAYVWNIQNAPPVVTCPSDITVECTGPTGQVVTYSASATDSRDGTIPIFCTPRSGSTFNYGTTTVACTATDSYRESTTCTFTVNVVDTTAPSITCPADRTIDCTSPGGSQTTYSATATDVCDPSPSVDCVPASGSTFGGGTTTVTCTATDSSSNSSSCSFTVTVLDMTAPAITCPADRTLECTSPAGAATTYSASATDDCDTSPLVSCVPASGSTFGFGSTLVTCTATDSASNSSSCSFTVTVLDTTAPVIACPADQSLECTSPAGAAATYSASATDVCDMSPSVSCVPASGSTFRVGTTMVTCTATDSARNVSSCSFTVTVEDTTLPEIACPGDIQIACADASGADVAFHVTASDECDGSIPVTCVPTSGSHFPPGETVVTCTADDAAGNSVQCAFSVIVRDQSCAIGTVNTGIGDAADVLRINRSAGDLCNREETVPRGMPITVELDAAPAGPDPGRYVVWGWRSLPTIAYPLATRSETLGCLVNPSPFHPGATPRPFQCIRGGVSAVACRLLRELPGAPLRAPWSLTRNAGLSRPIVLTFQGVLEDDGAANSRGYSVTNAVTLRVQ